MISLNSLLNMVATEAVEATEQSGESYSGKTETPCIRYNLELIEQSDGSLEWME